MQNLGTLRQLFLGDLADDGREERERERERGERKEKIMPSLMATSLRWRTHSAWTNIKNAASAVKAVLFFQSRTLVFGKMW